ncbi:hypothetical protein, partial [Pedobacter kyungheensis]|uniref:hypothetical protein n=1 Tax=Pedobacter kyungheensis TaxID=1069985 RepID=UPI001AE0AB67
MDLFKGFSAGEVLKQVQHDDYVLPLVVICNRDLMNKPRRFQKPARFLFTKPASKAKLLVWVIKFQSP